MNENDNKPERFRIDDLVLDSGAVTLSRGGESVALPKLSFDFLLCLVRNAPNVVTTDALMREVWQGVIVNEETVKQRAKLLRQSLGENSRKPRYFEAVRGRGYRVIAEVTKIVQEDPARGRWRRTLPGLLWVLLVMAVSIALAIHWSKEPVPDSGAGADVMAAEAGISRTGFEALQNPPTDRFEAYNAYLKGRAAYRRWTRQDNETALAFYRQAVEADPEFALAIAGMANALALRATQFGMGREWAAEAVETAQRALDIQPGLAEAHKALGICLFFDGRYQEALDHNREALKQRPDYDEALFNTAEILQLQGRWDESVRYQLLDSDRPKGKESLSIYLRNLGFDEEADALTRQLETDLPVSYFTLDNRSLHELLDGDFAAARETAHRMQSLQPALVIGELREAETALLEGRHEQAESIFRSASEKPGLWQDYARLRLAQLLGPKGDEQTARALLKQVESNTLLTINAGHEGWFLRWNLAAVHALSGNRETALNWYERAVESGRRLYEWDLVDPAFESIAGEPRFRTAIERQRQLREQMSGKTAALLQQQPVGSIR